ncbi:thiamine pyrophosphate-binding protein [Acuticoccus mangrovi]|uniref:Thiamine pyrophosphate-binding protein n=1 Tax=Acuticoccus mangrovi TaxID=2796142 RepID=A0A934IMR1_9HYPH|nr:thiamine pyrophosphate-binding protein [Acuticoccus mangrovi]MBJ3775072.1 thiamine pyrophosphate-binding protein [Acuticoccus mangrovi]
MTLPEAPTNADLIANKLAASGCAHAFGIPGGEVLAIIDALTRAGIAFHLTKHENVAGFMAEGAWHASGAPGILVATIGPGVANAVNVVANAMQDRVPLIFITGCVDHVDADTYTHQVFDHQALLAPVVKGTFRATTGSLDKVMDKALALAQTGQPGPVHIDLPIGVATATAGSVSAPPAVGAGFRPVDGPEMKRARAWLKAAERPIAIAGVDAVNDDAGRAVSAFVKAIGAPLVTTYKGKGLLDEADSLALGGAGLSPLADTHLLPLIAAADCILLIGYDPIEMRVGWRDPWPDDARVIDITPVVRDHGMHRVGVTLYGSIRATLHDLVDGGTFPPTWPAGEPKKVRAALAEAFAPEASGWGPGAVFHAMREALPEETVVTADSGAHRILLSQIWRCRAPRAMLQSSALCTMGCAVPLAAGHRTAAPETPVTAFVGDAGLEMTLGDLATIRDMGLAVPIVVLVDESLALIELKQRAGQLPNVGVDFAGTDFPALAAAMGGHGVWIDDVETLKREAKAALERPTFTLLCARIGRRAYDGKF